MSTYIIAFDLGTGGNKASIYDTNGNRLLSHFESYTTQYPHPNWHEQRPEDWFDAVKKSTKELVNKSNIKKEDIKYLAISGHSMAPVPVGKNGELLRESVPIWSDTRAQKQTKEFFDKIDYNDWYRTTGNGFSKECYSTFKVMWYRDNEPEMFKNIYKIIGTKDYINLKLTGKIYTDNSYASGSGVYNLKERKYKLEYIKASGLPESIFPEIVSSHTKIGKILPSIADSMGLPHDLTVMAGGVDNSCMALGAGNISEGKAYLSLGTSAWIAVSSENPVIDDKIYPFVFDHVVPGLYTSATSIFSAGNSFRWLGDVICESYKEKAKKQNKDFYDLLIEEAMESPIGSNGVIFNPSLAGAPAAYLKDNVKGAFLGIELMHSKSDVIRSVIEGITLDLNLMYNKLTDICKIEDEITIVGGGSKNVFWRQMFADIFGCKFARINTDQEAASLGAAAIAAVGAGIWKDYNEINNVIKKIETAVPNNEVTEKYKKIISIYPEIIVKLSEISDLMN
jgi:xylulokinase